LKIKFFHNFILIFLWVLLPLAHWSWGYDPNELPKVLLFVCVINVSLGMWLIILYKRMFVKRSVVFWLILATLVWNAVTSVLGDRPIISLAGLGYRYEGWLTLLALSELSYLVAVLKPKPKIVSKWVIVGSMATMAVMLVNGGGDWGGRWAGWMGNPNFAGGWLALNLVWLNGLWGLVATILIGFSQSRSAILGALTSVGIVYFLKTNKWVVSGAIAVATIVFLIVSSGWRWSKFDNRLIFWQKAVGAAVERPLIGWGRENFEIALTSQLNDNDLELREIRVDRAHNEWLEILVASGIPGVVLWSLLLGRVGWVLYKKKSEGYDRYLAVLGAFVVISSLNVLNINQYIWFYWIAGVAMAWETEKV
jgi:O-antigen ligase